MAQLNSHVAAALHLPKMTISQLLVNAQGVQGKGTACLQTRIIFLKDIKVKKSKMSRRQHEASF